MPPPPNADLGYVAHIDVAPADVLGAMLVGLVATVLASLIPARMASRIPIVDALREAV
jgi:putative ABC transport system permease protein